MSVSGNSNLIWLDNAINRANEMFELRTRLAHRRGQNHCCVTVPLRANLFIDESTFVCKSICRNSRTEIRIMTDDSLFLFTIRFFVFVFRDLRFFFFFFLFLNETIQTIGLDFVSSRLWLIEELMRGAIKSFQKILHESRKFNWTSIKVEFNRHRSKSYLCKIFNL